MTKEEIEDRDPLQAWISEQLVSDKMLWKRAFGAQVRFLRDTLRYLIAVGLESPKEIRLLGKVISTHRSKSILLPVVEYDRKDLGLRLIFRNNFYNWKMSVVSETPIEANFDGLFHTTSPIDPSYTGNPLSSVYFEGFPPDLIFGYYAESDKKKWSADIWGGDEPLWTAVFLIMRARGAVKAAKWAVRK